MVRLPLVLLVGFLLGLPAEAEAQSRLEPEPGPLFQPDKPTENTRRTVRHLLSGEPFHHRARIVAIPSFDRAWSVTLTEVEPRRDAEPNDAPGRFLLRYATYDHRRSPHPEKPEVERFEAPLDREAGVAVQRAWLYMLRRVRHPKEPRIGADGTEYHFSRAVPVVAEDQATPFGFESGRIWSPRPGTATALLVHLSEELRAYATAKEEDRPKHRERILCLAEEIQPKEDAQE